MISSCKLCIKANSKCPAWPRPDGRCLVEFSPVDIDQTVTISIEKLASLMCCAVAGKTAGENGVDIINYISRHKDEYLSQAYFVYQTQAGKTTKDHEEHY